MFDLTQPHTVSPEAQRIGAAFALDAAETMLFSRALEHVKRTVFEVKYEDLKARQFCPFSTEAGPLKDTVTYRVWDAYVQATIVTRMTTQLPIVNASGREYTVRFKQLGAAYQYGYDDAKIAAATGSDLIARLAMAARKAIELAIDEIVALGNPETGMTGMANHPNVPVVSVPNGSWTTATTPDDQLEDLFYLDTVIETATQNVLHGRTLLLPYAAFKIASGTLVGQEKTNSVLKVFLAQSMNIKEVDFWHLLDTAAEDGGPRALLYSRDPLVLEAELGVEFEQLPGQVVGLSTTVPCRAKIAGVSVHHPKGMAKIDNLLP